MSEMNITERSQESIEIFFTAVYDKVSCAVSLHFNPESGGVSDHFTGYLVANMEKCGT